MLKMFSCCQGPTTEEEAAYVEPVIERAPSAYRRASSFQDLEPSMENKKVSQRVNIHSESHLRELLEADTTDLTQWGVGKAKNVKHLYNELIEGSCFVERSADTGRLSRVVEPVFVQVIWRGRSILVNTVQELEDGRQRERNMLLSEKKEPRDDGSLTGLRDAVWDTVIRGMSEELNIPTAELLAPDVLRLRQDEYLCSTLQKDSFSYPGLPCMYRNHYVIVDVLNTEAALQTFASCGLPGENDFVTTEPSKMGERKHHWVWMPIGQARKDKIKEFPPNDESQLKRGENKDQSGMFVRKIRVDTQAELGAVLESEGLDLSAFGVGGSKTVQSLFKELSNGDCHLERALAVDGAVRRVVEPVFVQLRWRDKVLMNTSQVLEDGRMRSKHMLLAKKKRPDDVERKVVHNGGGVWETAKRAIIEELGIPAETLEQQGIIYINQNSHFCSEMSSLGFSYPGLYCLYRTHYVAIDVLENPKSMQAFSKCGLPDANDFETWENHSAEGTRKNSWRWISIEDAVALRVKEFPPGTLSAERSNLHSKNRVEIMSVDELRTMLEEDGVDTCQFGVGQAKSLRALYHELMEGSCVLERSLSGGKMQRTVEPVFVELRYRGRVLLNTSQKLEDGRERERGMLLAEKKHPRDDGSKTKRAGHWDTAVRGIAEELGLNVDQLLSPGVLQLKDDEYASSTLVKESFSYPGVACRYKNHYLVADILDTDVARCLFGACGLPDLRPFNTTEAHRLGQRINIWEWVAKDRAQEEFQVRMYPSFTQS